MKETFTLDNNQTIQAISELQVNSLSNSKQQINGPSISSWKQFLDWLDKKAANLEILNLNALKIDDRHLALLQDHLSKARMYPKLKRLNLDDNTISGLGAEKLCEFMQANNSVVELSIAHNNMDKGTLAFAEFLQQNTNLKALNLQHNTDSYYVKPEFLKMFKHNYTLLDFRLTCPGRPITFPKDHYDYFNFYFPLRRNILLAQSEEKLPAELTSFEKLVLAEDVEQCKAAAAERLSPLAWKLACFSLNPELITTLFLKNRYVIGLDLLFQDIIDDSSKDKTAKFLKDELKSSAIFFLKNDNQRFEKIIETIVKLIRVMNPHERHIFLEQCKRLSPYHLGNRISEHLAKAENQDVMEIFLKDQALRTYFNISDAFILSKCTAVTIHKEMAELCQKLHDNFPKPKFSNHLFHLAIYQKSKRDHEMAQKLIDYLYNDGNVVETPSQHFLSFPVVNRIKTINVLAQSSLQPIPEHLLRECSGKVIASLENYGYPKWFGQVDKVLTQVSRPRVLPH